MNWGEWVHFITPRFILNFLQNCFFKEKFVSEPEAWRTLQYFLRSIPTNMRKRNQKTDHLDS